MSSPHQDIDEAITYINVVPLVDIMLVLLIVFMLTASFINAPSLPISTPKSFTAEPTAPASQSLILTKERGYIYKNKKVTEEELKSRLAEDSALNADLRLVLSADASMPHGDVVKVIDLARSVGIKKIALGVTQ